MNDGSFARHHLVVRFIDQTGDCRFEGRFAVGSIDPDSNHVSQLAATGSADASLNLELPGSARNIISGFQEHIANMVVLCTVEFYITMNASLPPLVLILDIAGIAPAHDHQRDGIGATDQIIRHIKLARQSAVLGESDFLAVDVQIKAVFDAAQINHHSLTLPVLG